MGSYQHPRWKQQQQAPSYVPDQSSSSPSGAASSGQASGPAQALPGATGRTTLHMPAESQAKWGSESNLARFLHLRLLRLRWQGGGHRRYPKQSHRQVPQLLSVWCSGLGLLLHHQGYLLAIRHHHRLQVRRHYHRLQGHRQFNHLSSAWQCRHRRRLLALPQEHRQFIKFLPLLR